MQSVAPVDIELALATELSAALGVPAHASPVPDGIGPGALVVQSLGSIQQSLVSDSFSVVVYAYGMTYDEAMWLGTRACSCLRTLWLFDTGESGVTFTTSEANAPYEDPDPDRPTLRRATVRAIIGVRGVPADRNDD